MVSKNGNLLLNIPVRGDGSIDEKEIAILENIAAWMDINKESIFDTRPWIVFGEGPSAEMKNPITAQGFNEGKIKFSAKDIRFNAKGKVLYATVMGTPLKAVGIKNLALQPAQTRSNPLNCSEVRNRSSGPSTTITSKWKNWPFSPMRLPLFIKSLYGKSETVTP